MALISPESIKRRVEAFEVDQQKRFADLFTSQELNNFRSAAVMIPMLIHAGEWHLLLTHRSENLVEHRGQVAFPGGAFESGDESLLYTALREMNEEIGIRMEDVNILGHLGDMSIITGFLVRLFVGQIPWPYDLKISEYEVQSVFIVPLRWLNDPDHRKIQYRSYAGREFPVIYFDNYEGHQLWGASAEMTLALLSALELKIDHP